MRCTLQAVAASVAEPVAEPPMGVTPAVPAPAPVPLLWQQQRQGNIYTLYGIRFNTTL